MKLTHQEIETMGPEAVAQALEAAEGRIAEMEADAAAMREAITLAEAWWGVRESWHERSPHAQNKAETAARDVYQAARDRALASDAGRALLEERDNLRARLIHETALHGNGACACHGEGECQWCRMVAAIEERDALKASVAKIEDERRVFKARLSDAFVREARSQGKAEAEIACLAARVAKLEAARERHNIPASTLALGCHDYNGGRSGRELEAFHHGIDTVVNVLRAAESGKWDTQLAVVAAIGEDAARAEQARSKP